MGEISDLENRINSALDRITKGLDGLEPPGPVVDPKEMTRLQSELEIQHVEKAALQAKIEDLLMAHDQHMSEHGVQIEAQKTQMQDLDDTLQRLRHANVQLRENNRALRQANEDGVADPHLINNSMLAELEGLRSTRAADKAEADAIISALRPMLRAAQDQSGT